MSGDWVVLDAFLLFFALPSKLKTKRHKFYTVLKNYKIIKIIKFLNY
jgi:hypothetical protein